MSCSAKKDANGTWRIQYRWKDWTGTNRKSQKRGFRTKKEAEEWYAHFLLQQSSDPTMTLNDFWEIYKVDMAKRLRKTTMKQKEYRRDMSYVNVYIEKIVDDVFPIFVQCKLVDSSKKPHYFIDKLPIFSENNERPPGPGIIRCNILEIRDTVVLIDTTYPDDIESVDGENQFVVNIDQVIL